MDQNGQNTISIREELRVELEETRQAFHRLMADVPAKDWEKPTANPAWNVRQVLWHMTLAVDMLPQDVRMIRAGRMFTPQAWLFNKINIWYTRFGARKASSQSLALRYDRAQAKVINLLDDIDDDEWQLTGNYPDINENLSGGQRSLEDMFHYLTAHFREHEEEVRGAIAGEAM